MTCKCEHWQVCDECRPMRFPKTEDKQMTKELLQQALNEAKADAIEVFTYEDGIAQSARDAIEYMHSWLGVYFEKQALAQQEHISDASKMVGKMQGGLTNDELIEAWDYKVPGVSPNPDQLTAFALGIELGEAGKNVYFVERNSARDALHLLNKRLEAQQEQPESWTRHPNPVHHIGPLSEEHLRDVVERTKAMQVALDAWVAQAQSGQTEVPCPLAFVEQSASVDAYVGAREDAAIWKKRALEAEELNRKFIAELNGPTYLGEPVKQDQPAQEPCGYLDEFGNFENMLLAWTRMKEEPGVAWAPVYKRPAPTQPAMPTHEAIYETIINWDEGGGKRSRRELARRIKALYQAPPTQPALSDDEIWQFWCNRPEVPEGEDDSMEAEFVAACKRAIEAHCRGGANK